MPLQKFSDLLSGLNPIVGFRELSEVLDRWCLHLQQNEDINMKLQICCLCKHPILQANLSSLIKINCNHLVCSNECLCNYAISKNQDLSQYKDTKCPHENCNSYISSETIEDAFGGIEKLLKLIASQENLQALICPISKERHGVGCNITLDCSHIFCKSCIRTYLEECIGDCKISESDLSC